MASEALKSLPEANTLIHVAKRVIYLEINQKKLRKFIYFICFKENLHLQLEAALRQRMAEVFNEVKRRLDYQVALQNVHKRVEREQAVSYIIDGVNKSIGAAQVSPKLIYSNNKLYLFNLI